VFLFFIGGYAMRFLFLAMALCLVGCGPELSERELGNVKYELPKVKGVDERYTMPQLDPLPEKPQEHSEPPTN
jgi:hypothetical protein